MTQPHYQFHQPTSWRLDDPALADPWKTATLDDGSSKNDWMMSYVDILTLLLTLVVMLLAYQKIQYGASPQTSDSIALQAPGPAQPVALERPEDSPSLSDIASDKPDSVFTDFTPAIDTAMEIPNIPAVEPQVIAVNDIPQVLIIDDSELNREASSESFEQDLSVDDAIEQEGLGKQIEVSQAESEIRLEISNDIMFPSASASLMAEGIELMEKLATIINQRPGTVFIEGHTDNTPISTSRYPSNWDLSSARATMVTRHLVAHGVSPDRLRAVGYADTKPRDADDTPEAKARNRRVSIVISLPKNATESTAPYATPTENELTPPDQSITPTDSAAGTASLAAPSVP